MPPIESGFYLVEYLFEIGPTVAAGMGAGPITFQELLAWQIVTAIRLERWEARFIRHLSLEYLNESHKARKIDAHPPWKQPGAKPPKTAAQLALRALAEG